MRISVALALALGAPSLAVAHTAIHGASAGAPHMTVIPGGGLPSYRLNVASGLATVGGATYWRSTGSASAPTSYRGRAAARAVAPRPTARPRTRPARKPPTTIAEALAGDAASFRQSFARVPVAAGAFTTARLTRAGLSGGDALRAHFAEGPDRLEVQLKRVRGRTLARIPELDRRWTEVPPGARSIELPVGPRAARLAAFPYTVDGPQRSLRVALASVAGPPEVQLTTLARSPQPGGAFYQEAYTRIWRALP